MKKLLLLSERLPYPPTSGTKNLLYNYCRVLNLNLGIEIINVSFLEQDDDIEKKPEFISKTYPLPNPRGLNKISNILCKTFLLRKYPLQVSLFWDENIKKKIDEIIVIENPDFVVADFIRTTEYLKDYKGFKIADLQDLLSLRYQRQLSMDLQSINPYGAYLYRLPKFAQIILKNRLIKKSVMKMEIQLLQKFEKNVGKNYDRVMFVAKKEAALFNKMIGDTKSLVAPLGVEYQYFSERISNEKRIHSIAFMGALNVTHNEYGIVHFIRYCFPTILKQVPDTKLFIVGSGASEELKKYASNSVIFLGRVPDVRVPLQECEVFICPLQFGSGIKTKNLEAMAMQLPVVTTGIGAENIDAIDGRDWMVADEDKHFAECVVEIMTDKEKAKSISLNGQRFIKENFTWEYAQKAFEEVFLKGK